MSVVLILEPPELLLSFKRALINDNLFCLGRPALISIALHKELSHLLTGQGLLGIQPTTTLVQAAHYWGPLDW